MDCIERDRGKMNQVHVPIEASIEAEVAQVGRHTLKIGGVVAEHHEGDSLLFVGGRQLLDRLGNVDNKLVIAALMRPNEHRPDPYRGGLARALKVQQGASTGERIADSEPRPVPPLAAKVRLVGVARIVRIHAMRQISGLPQTNPFGSPNFVDAAHRALTELPARIQPQCRRNGFVIRGNCPTS